VVDSLFPPGIKFRHGGRGGGVSRHRVWGIRRTAAEYPGAGGGGIAATSRFASANKINRLPKGDKRRPAPDFRRNRRGFARAGFKRDLLPPRTGGSRGPREPGSSSKSWIRTERRPRATLAVIGWASPSCSDFFPGRGPAGVHPVDIRGRPARGSLVCGSVRAGEFGGGKGMGAEKNPRLLKAWEGRHARLFVGTHGGRNNFRRGPAERSTGRSYGNGSRSGAGPTFRAFAARNTGGRFSSPGHGILLGL